MTEHDVVVEQAGIPVPFTLLADRIPGVVWSTDTGLRFTASFGSGLAALGLHPSQVVGTTLYQYFETDDEDFPVIAAHRRALQGASLDFEQSWQGRTYQVHLEPLRDAAQTLVGCIGFAQDITAKKQVEEELRRSEAKWRSVVDNAPVLVAIVDHDGTIVFFNRPVAGYTHETVIGKSAYEFIHPEYIGRARESIEHVLRTGAAVLYESVAAGPNGTVSSYETRVGPVSIDGQIVAATLISSDITERKRADEGLQQAKEQLEYRVRERTAELAQANQGLREEVDRRRQAEEGLAIFRRFIEASSQGFGMADVNGKILYANPFLARLFGVPGPDCLIGTHVSDYYPPDYEVRRSTEIMPALRRKESWHGEQLMLFPDGQLHPTIHTVFPVLDENEQLLRTAVVITDITELKQTEDTLRHQNALLQRALRAGDLERKVIAYDIHDTLSQHIAGATMQFEASEEYRRKRKRQAAVEAFEEGMRTIRECQTEARRLIRGVRPLTLDQSGVVVALAQFFQGLAGKAGPHVEFQSDVVFERLQAKEEDAVYRIVQEAVTNARRHSESENVRVELVQQSDQLRIVIQDWGIGFDLQAAGQYTFGLDSIRERAKMLGGHAEIETAPGQGTRITVELPVLLPDED